VKKFVILMTMLAGACGSSGSAVQTQRPIVADASLFDRLGGLDAIKAVVDDFVANIAANPDINARFANTDVDQLKARLVEQICEATGGGCAYRGKNMVEAHAGMNISEAEFDSMVGDLKKSLDRFRVQEREQRELLGALGAMKGDIVNK
jgi:hemoglobin